MSQAEPTEESSYRAFTLNPRKPEISLDICLRSHKHVGIPYSYIFSISIDTMGLLTIETTHIIVKVEGTNLYELYEALLAQRVVSINEGDMDEYKHFENSDEPFIYRITVERG